MSGQKPHLPWSKHCVFSHKRRWSSLTLGMNIDYNIPRIQGIPLLGGMTWWPSPIASEVMVLSYQIILWLAKRCMSAVQWQDDPIYGRVGGVQFTVCLLVLQKWPLKIHGFIWFIQFPSSKSVPPGMSSPAGNDEGNAAGCECALAPTDQLRESWHGLELRCPTGF